ncbi:MAG TPA: TetR/AcrR family transcriptional regulator [Candidatus Megamonas gallistercoris]|nr:TetR/AcrR family transcriptional regulator [Candidatus Megamonas gallistercoris]
MKNTTKEMFLHTASVLFANKGYHATGINEILQKSRAPKGSLYYYFPHGKEQLAIESLELTAQKIYNEITDTLSQYDNPLKGFQKHLQYIAQKVQEDIDNPREDKDNISISLIALETFSSNELIRTRCQEIFAHMQSIYRQKFIQYGIEPDTADFFAMNAVILTEGALILTMTRKDSTPLYELANKLPMLFNINIKSR